MICVYHTPDKTKKRTLRIHINPGGLCRTNLEQFNFSNLLLQLLLEESGVVELQRHGDVQPGFFAAQDDLTVVCHVHDQKLVRYKSGHGGIEEQQGLSHFAWRGQAAHRAVFFQKGLFAARHFFKGQRRKRFFPLGAALFARILLRNRVK